MRRLLAVAALAVAALVALPEAAVGHPLGNFTVNQYVGLTVRPDGLDVDYVVDMAEIPTFQELRRYEGDDPAGRYAAESCPALATGLATGVDGAAVPLQPVASHGELRPGQAGLDTLRFECTYRGAWDAAAGERAVTFALGNFDERLGWRELVVHGAGVSLSSDALTAAISGRLESYPEDLLQSPPDQRSTAFRFVATGEAPAETTTTAPADATAASPSSDGFLRPPDAFASLISRADLGPLALAGALLVAFLLGAGHALAPGHGKTIMAAYLVGTRGTVPQAAGLALAVAVSHTLGVLALGVVTVWLTAAWDPARVYPYLSLAAGLVVLGVGVALLVRWWRRRAHGHSHAHGHDHNHDHGHDHPVPGGRVGWRSLVALGLSGGLVPSASAVVLLLGAVSLRRVPLGIVLIALFGLGMAVALVSVGLILVYAGDWVLDRVRGGRLHAVATRVLAPSMAALVVVIGLILTVDAARGV